ncbi:MAG: hypothetical protein GYA36_20875 [Veillonellaceae bacterium]|nr:hypothetical protein [Veillonellaceae bacterium]
MCRTGTSTSRFLPTKWTASPPAPATLTVSKKTADCAITGWSRAYDGQPHGASSACTGSDGTVLPGLNLGATFTNVPGGTPLWTFTGGSDYTDQSGDVDTVIEKAAVTIYRPILFRIYDGSPMPVAVTTDLARLNVALTHEESTTPPSAVDSYAVVATVSDANYQGSASCTLVISPVADLRLSKRDSKNPVKPGASLVLHADGGQRRSERR